MKKLTEERIEWIVDILHNNIQFYDHAGNFSNQETLEDIRKILIEKSRKRGFDVEEMER